jgi:hypothetical protein
LPLSRLSTADIVREAQRAGIVATISNKTVWRWFNEDAIRPWQHRTWIFPRDPDFAIKAGRVLDLYAREWDGKALKSNEFVISADEKTSIQARLRRQPTLPPRPGQVARVEHEYRRGGAWAYLAALDVHRAKDVRNRRLRFQDYYETIATPFQWTFTRADLAEFMKKLSADPVELRSAA